MDKREKVARAIARPGLIPASREWEELLPETRDPYMQQADDARAALAARDKQVREAALRATGGRGMNVWRLRNETA